MPLGFNDLPLLTEQCYCCNRFIFPDGPEPVPCPEGCVNSIRPTEFGRAVLDLVRTFLPERRVAECE